MSYGFKSINNDGITQIDGANDNIAIIATGTAVAQTKEGPLDNTTVPYPANLPDDILIFAKPSDPEAATGIPFTCIQKSTGLQFLLPRYNTATIDIDWAIGVKHSDMPADTSPGWGIKIFNDSGGAAFSSNNKNFRCQYAAFEIVEYLRWDPVTVFNINDLTTTYCLMTGHGTAGYVWSGQLRLIYSIFIVYDINAGPDVNQVDGTIGFWTGARQAMGFNMGGNSGGRFGSGSLVHLVGSIV